MADSEHPGKTDGVVILSALIKPDGGDGGDEDHFKMVMVVMMVMRPLKKCDSSEHFDKKMMVM